MSGAPTPWGTAAIRIRPSSLMSGVDVSGPGQTMALSSGGRVCLAWQCRLGLAKCGLAAICPQIAQVRRVRYDAVPP